MLPPYCDTTHKQNEAAEASTTHGEEAKCAHEGYMKNSAGREEGLSNEQVSMPSI